MDEEFPVKELWRKLAHRHFRRNSDSPQVTMAPSENTALRTWLINLSKDPSWQAPFMKEPFKKWKMHACTCSHKAGPKMWVLCEKDDVHRTSTFVSNTLIPLMRDMVSLLIHTGVPASVFQGSEVVFVAIRFPLRMLPTKHGQPVKPENINGGLSYQNRRVLVYRVQDAAKVMVHELLHLAGLDDSLRTGHAWSPVNDAQNAIAQRYGVESNSHPLGLNESYTEILACYLHTLWWAAKEETLQRSGSKDSRLSNSGSINSSPKQSTRRINAEDDALSKMAFHIQTVARRVWRHHTDSSGRVSWVERTHCFSYVACRAAIWTSPFLLRFLEMYPPGKTPQDPHAYARLMIEAMDVWLSKNKRFITKNLPAFGTSVRGGSLKMSCFS